MQLGRKIQTDTKPSGLCERLSSSTKKQTASISVCSSAIANAIGSLTYVRCPPLTSSLTLFPFSPHSVGAFVLSNVFPHSLQTAIPFSRIKLPEQAGHFGRSGFFFSGASKGFSSTVLIGFSFLAGLRNLRSHAVRRFAASSSWPIISSCSSAWVGYSVSLFWTVFASCFRFFGFLCRPN